MFWQGVEASGTGKHLTVRLAAPRGLPNSSPAPTCSESSCTFPLMHPMPPASQDRTCSGALADGSRAGRQVFLSLPHPLLGRRPALTDPWGANQRHALESGTVGRNAGGLDAPVFPSQKAGPKKGRSKYFQRGIRPGRLIAACQGSHGQEAKGDGNCHTEKKPISETEAGYAQRRLRRGQVRKRVSASFSPSPHFHTRFLGKRATQPLVPNPCSLA